MSDRKLKLGLGDIFLIEIVGTPTVIERYSSVTKLCYHSERIYLTTIGWVSVTRTDLKLLEEKLLCLTKFTSSETLT